MTAATGVPSGRLGTAGLIAGPLFLVAGAAVFFLRDAIIALGLDVAKVQGGLGLPLLLLSPAALALAWSPGGPIAEARLAVRLISVGIAGFVTVLVATSVTQIGCRPISSPLEALIPSALLGLAAGFAFFVAIRLARPSAAAGHPARAVAIGVSTGLVAVGVLVVLLIVLFPPLSCAAPRI
ncbi:MAG TPA: hypothetical protein VNH13_06255 [Candidatus Acidoferrales bacterium]|nr:hypothetical protein [Candidatus Acidoferrales bacterium]